MIGYVPFTHLRRVLVGGPFPVDYVHWANGAASQPTFVPFTHLNRRVPVGGPFPSRLSTTFTGRTASQPTFTAGITRIVMYANEAAAMTMARGTTKAVYKQQPMSARCPKVCQTKIKPSVHNMNGIE